MKKLLLPLALATLLSGCSQQQASDQRTPEQKQAATTQTSDDQARANGEKLGEKAREAEVRTRAERERLRIEAEQMGRDLKKGARELGKQAAAAGEGIREGWKRGDSATVDLNSATTAQLHNLGLSDPDARAIITHRPYGSKQELTSRNVISGATYRGIEDRISVH